MSENARDAYRARFRLAVERANEAARRVQASNDEIDAVCVSIGESKRR